MEEEEEEEEEDGGGGWRRMEGGSQPGRLDRLWTVTLQLNEPTLPG